MRVQAIRLTFLLRRKAKRGCPLYRPWNTELFYCYHIQRTKKHIQDAQHPFPVIGRLKVGGLTKNEAEDLIREQLQPYLKESPIVTVRMANYKISVLGEVNRPGTFTVGNEKVNILEALAMAGDMTVYGVRDNVKLIREDAKGKREIINLNLNNAELVVSPYYYLRQNDIIYVTPNKTKAKNSDIGSSTSMWISATSILVSLASLLATILK